MKLILLHETLNIYKQPSQIEFSRSISKFLEPPPDNNSSENNLI